MLQADVIELDGVQAIRLPDGIRFESDAVAIRRESDAVILEPIRPTEWPEGFFEAIRIDDPSFERPPQGSMPPVSELS